MDCCGGEEVSEPALMAVSLAAMRTLEREFGVGVGKALYVAGHSLGEYSALAAAGALTISGLPSVAERVRVVALSDEPHMVAGARVQTKPHKQVTETLVLRLVEGMTGPEIAARTGLQPASVRVNLHRGMKLLRERLGMKGREI